MLKKHLLLKTVLPPINKAMWVKLLALIENDALWCSLSVMPIIQLRSFKGNKDHFPSWKPEDELHFFTCSRYESFMPRKASLEQIKPTTPLPSTRQNIGEACHIPFLLLLGSRIDIMSQRGQFTIWSKDSIVMFLLQIASIPSYSKATRNSSRLYPARLETHVGKKRYF